jgi:hypothetical protein
VATGVVDVAMLKSLVLREASKRARGSEAWLRSHVDTCSVMRSEPARPACNPATKWSEWRLKTAGPPLAFGSVGGLVPVNKRVFTRV